MTFSSYSTSRYSNWCAYAVVACVWLSVPGNWPGGSRSARALEPIQIGLLVDNMASKGSGYDARELHSLGVSGLAAVLDYFLPDTAPPAAPLPAGLPAATVRKLIVELEHD